jgi:hypothetical protein
VIKVLFLTNEVYSFTLNQDYFIFIVSLYTIFNICKGTKYGNVIKDYLPIWKGRARLPVPVLYESHKATQRGITAKSTVFATGLTHF